MKALPTRRGLGGGPAWLLLTLAWLGVTVAAAPAPGGGAKPDPRWQQRWLYISSNLYVDANLPKLKQLCERAARAGYNGVLFADYKTGTWWTLEDADRWAANARKLRQITQQCHLELTVVGFPFGRASSLLSHDINLASGVPVKDALLVARDGQLIPAEQVPLKNGSFEEHQGEVATGFSFQDDPGKGSFIDTETVKHGLVSLRFEDVGQANQYGHGRICQKLEVRPWQQYRVRVWMKTEHLTADQIQLLVMGGERVLQYQFPRAQQGNDFPAAGQARDLTTDWVEQSVTFNSLDYTQVNIYVGVWGGKTGKIWWDDLRVEPAPTMNVLRRDSLPLTVIGEDGTVFKEGKDFAPVADPGLGALPWPGNYDTRHEPPAIMLTRNSKIRDGQTVKLSCYHCLVVHEDQVNCSMVEPAIFARCEEQLRHTRETLAPDGYFLSHDEIRCAGWEPQEVARFKTSGELFAFNIKRCLEIARQQGKDRPVYAWSDMFDPNHNAKQDYYLVNNTLEGSWLGLDPQVIIMKWGSGAIARPGLQFFAQRGHRQMIAAYYDADVTADHQAWLAAAAGVQNIIGVMYTTWGNDYSNLEKFAQEWWGYEP